ncbi:hypothetical protein [Streptomyces sp. NPDC051546]
MDGRDAMPAVAMNGEPLAFELRPATVTIAGVARAQHREIRREERTRTIPGGARDRHSRFATAG